MNHNAVPFEEAIEKFANAPKAPSDPATYGDGPTKQELAKTGSTDVNFKTDLSAAACASNPNVRYEWDDYSTSDKNALMSAFKCLMNKPPSGAFAHSTSRWEDFAALHQAYTPNVHSTSSKRNAKFLLWHRYFIWTFEQVLRDECGFDRAFFWFDETKHAGAFSSSTAFSANYLGRLNADHHCVTDGQFGGLTVNIGPGTGFQSRCLDRAGNSQASAQCNTGYVNSCLSNSRYDDFASCFELGPHSYGHSGVGGVGGDLYASPAEPFFWFHHTFVDRVYRIWELADTNTRYNTLSGTDINGNAITMDTKIYMGGIRPDTTVREMINTLSGSTLCYRYNY
ncbi:Di-copper centre-containing protein [Xylariaceae sp. FL1272]|nr:Di-copper centre-containing protein [Xylariaceae sp. FL1272]